MIENERNPTPTNSQQNPIESTIDGYAEAKQFLAEKPHIEPFLASVAMVEAAKGSTFSLAAAVDIYFKTYAFQFGGMKPQIPARLWPSIVGIIRDKHPELSGLMRP